MKNNLILIAALVATCLAVLSWQRGQIRELRDEVSETRSRLDSSTAKNEQSSSNHPPSTDSENSTDRETISETVDRLLAVGGDREEAENMAELIQQVGDALESLKERSGEELFLIMDELKNREATNSEAGDLGEILLMFFCDLEPEKSLRFLGKHYPDKPKEAGQLNLVAFSALAKNKPERAIELFEARTWKDKDIRDMIERKIIEGLASKDLVAVLDFFETTNSGHPSNRIGVIAQAVQISGRREQAWQILDDENLADDLRDHLGAGLLGAIGMESGLSGVEETLKRLKFSSTEGRDTALNAPVSVTIWTSPEETMEFIQREVSQERQLQQIQENLKKWASRDYTAAGNWLREQKASPVKNAAISAYADSVAKLDPPSALEWTSEITDKESQNRARRKVLASWHARDAQAAKNWVSRQGLSPTEWLPEK